MQPKTLSIVPRPHGSLMASTTITTSSLHSHPHHASFSAGAALTSSAGNPPSSSSASAAAAATANSDSSDHAAASLAVQMPAASQQSQPSSQQSFTMSQPSSQQTALAASAYRQFSDPNSRTNDEPPQIYSVSHALSPSQPWNNAPHPVMASKGRQLTNHARLGRLFWHQCLRDGCQWHCRDAPSP